MLLHYVIWVCGLIFFPPSRDLYELTELHSAKLLKKPAHWQLCNGSGAYCAGVPII